MLRSRNCYENLRENPSKYCFNLGKRNFISKTIVKLADENNIKYLTTNSILNYQKRYYEELYQEKLHLTAYHYLKYLGTIQNI